MIRLVAVALLFVGCSDAQPAGHGERVFLINTGGESVSVIDHDKRAVVATIDVDAEPHGLAAAPDGRRVYVTCGRGGGEVVALDTALNAVAWRLDVGREPQQPAIDREGRHLYVPDFVTGEVSVVDVRDRRVVAAIAPVFDGARLDRLHNAYLGAGGATLYVTAVRSRALVLIDVAKRAVRRIDRLPGEPRPAAVVADGSRAYVQLSKLHGFLEWDLAAAKEFRRVAWPEPEGAADAWTKCHGLGIAPGGAELWAASVLEHDVRVYSLPELKAEGRAPVGNTPNWIAFSRDGATVYVTNVEDGTVSVLDRAARRVVATLAVGARPKRIVATVVPRQTTSE